jgi:hypothetical protein
LKRGELGVGSWRGIGDGNREEGVVVLGFPKFDIVPKYGTLKI